MKKNLPFLISFDNIHFSNQSVGKCLMFLELPIGKLDDKVINTIPVVYCIYRYVMSETEYRQVGIHLTCVQFTQEVFILMKLISGV